MTDLKSRADELIDRSHLDTSAASWDRMNSEDYTEATRPSRAALTHFVHALCEVEKFAREYFNEYVQDEADDPEVCGTHEQHLAARQLRTALAALEKGEKA